MSEKEERLKDIKTENLIWVVYIGIIILSWHKKNTLYFIKMIKVKKNTKI